MPLPASRFRMFTGIILMLILRPATLISQETFAPSGGNAEGTTGNVSFTLGQIGYHSISDETGSITEGVQQPYEIFIYTGTNKDGNDFMLYVFPNPVSDYIKITASDQNPATFIYKLFNQSGVLIRFGHIVTAETYIPVNDLSPGDYILKISTINNEYRATFKIIKN